MAEDNFNTQRMFNAYIFEYMRSRNLHASAEMFRKEANLLDNELEVSSNGLLKEWWNFFSDVYSSREEISEKKYGENSMKDSTITIPTMVSPNVMVNNYGPSNNLPPNPGAKADKTAQKAWVLPRQTNQQRSSGDN